MLHARVAHQALPHSQFEVEEKTKTNYTLEVAYTTLIFSPLARKSDAVKQLKKPQRTRRTSEKRFPAPEV